jgi:hypothetical protein
MIINRRNIELSVIASQAFIIPEVATESAINIVKNIDGFLNKE